MTGPSPEVPLIDAAIGVLADGAARAILVIRGESMRPTLAPGDEVQVDLAAGPPRFGDLILFRQADYLVVHRYLGAATRGDGARYLRARGDGRIALDPPVDPAAVRGRVIAAKRQRCWRTLAGAAPRGWAIAIALHELFWSTLARIAPGAAAAADRALLLAIDAVAFKIVHRVVSDPPGAGGQARV